MEQNINKINNITKKQQTILTILFTFRFINSKQIQQFLNHKDHRRINSWLKDLVDKEYIERDFQPIFGTLTKPAVYFLSIKGRDFIRKSYFVDDIYLARLREDKKRSKAFRIRCQIVVDCFLLLFPDQVNEYANVIARWLDQSFKLVKSKQFQFVTPAFYEDVDCKLTSLLKPDAYGYLKNADGTTHIFFSILDAYIPKMMIRNKIKHIFTTLNEETWEDDEIRSLQFYVVCPNNVIIIYLKRLLPTMIENYSGNIDISFHLATRNQVYKRRDNKTAATGWISISSNDD
jgi:hypothetical protein